MTHIKTKEEIAIMQTGGKILAEVLREVIASIKPGVSELELDQLAEKLILGKGGEPGFKRVKGYKHTICVSTNDVVVHGIPTAYCFRQGDIVGVDCGVYYKGLHTDMAQTIEVRSDPPAGRAGKLAFIPSSGRGEVRSRNSRFLETGERALEEAIKVARVGNRIGHISKTIQDIIEGEDGYSVVHSLVGHGVGRNLHEEPEVPGFLRGTLEYTQELLNGMTIAVEVIYNEKGKEVVVDSDGWTIRTKDGGLSGVFERTIAITHSSPIVLTKQE